MYNEINERFKKRYVKFINIKILIFSAKINKKKFKHKITGKVYAKNLKKKVDVVKKPAIANLIIPNMLYFVLPAARLSRLYSIAKVLNPRNAISDLKKMKVVFI